MFRERKKKEFSTQINLGILQICKLKIAPIVEIRQTNRTLSSCFQGTF